MRGLPKQIMDHASALPEATPICPGTLLHLGDPDADPALRNAEEKADLFRGDGRQAAGGAGGQKQAAAIAVRNASRRRRRSRLDEWLAGATDRAEAVVAGCASCP